MKSTRAALLDSPTALQRGAGPLLFLLTGALAGCPSTTGDPVRITNVEVVGDASSTAFELEVEGRGFGFTRISFDVSEGTGTSSTVDLSLRIFRQNGGNARVFRRRALTIQSPRLMRADVRLDQPLVEGTYGVQLFEGMEQLAELPAAFEVGGDGPPGDAGVDAGEPGDAGAPDDAEVVEAGPPDTGAPPDAGFPDTGPPDTGVVVPFVGNYAYRRSVDVTSQVVAPAGATLVVPVPHATLVAEGKAEPDGRDLRIYQGTTPLDFQWSDRFAVGTDTLEIVARLARDVPVGGDPADPLTLYYGDPAATNTPGDGVFEFVERFAAEVAPQQQGNDDAWFSAAAWIHCNLDRPLEMILDPGTRGSYCALDRINGLARSTLATPRVRTMRNAPGANLVYEMSMWLAGQTPDGNEDIVYFSYGADNETFEATQDVGLGSWRGFVPNGQLTFQDSDGQPRTVDGWRFPPDTIQWWQRAYARFVPVIDQPSLHFRNVSTDNDSIDVGPSVDDWWVRLAVDPAPTIGLGPEEVRP